MQWSEAREASEAKRATATTNDDDDDGDCDGDGDGDDDWEGAFGAGAHLGQLIRVEALLFQPAPQAVVAAAAPLQDLGRLRGGWWSRRPSPRSPPACVKRQYAEGRMLKNTL